MKKIKFSYEKMIFVQFMAANESEKVMIKKEV